MKKTTNKTSSIKAPAKLGSVRMPKSAMTDSNLKRLIDAASKSYSRDKHTTYSKTVKAPKQQLYTSLRTKQDGGELNVAKTPEDFQLGIMKGINTFPFGVPGIKNMTMNTPAGNVPFPLKYTGLTNGKVTDTGVAYPGQNFKVNGDTVVEQPMMQMGGDTADINAMVKQVIAANMNKNFVQRVMNPNPPTTTYQGEPASHLMGYAGVDNKYVVYPNIVQGRSGNKLHIFDPELDPRGDAALDYAYKTGEYIEFDKEDDAKAFTENYKKEMAHKFEDGGEIDYKALFESLSPEKKQMIIKQLQAVPAANQEEMLERLLTQEKQFMQTGGTITQESSVNQQNTTMMDYDFIYQEINPKEDFVNRRVKLFGIKETPEQRSKIYETAKQKFILGSLTNNDTVISVPNITTMSPTMELKYGGKIRNYKKC